MVEGSREALRLGQYRGRGIQARDGKKKKKKTPSRLLQGTCYYHCNKIRLRMYVYVCVILQNTSNYGVAVVRGAQTHTGFNTVSMKHRQLT
jgi:hypothetical protein